MTKEEQQKVFEQALDNAWKDYKESGAATVDALEENTQKLAFAKGYNAGYKQALEHPTGGELLYVLNKRHEQGYKDAIDKACEWLFEYNKKQAKRFGAKSIMRLSDYTINVGDFRKAMEEQQ